MLNRLPTFHLPTNAGFSREYLNLLKWFALIAMTAFHATHALMYSQPESLVLLGRLAFPIFGFVLGFNLAGAIAKNDLDIEKRLMRMLLMFGCFAQPFYWSFVYSFLPLNIMFTLALGVFIVFRYKSYSAWLVVALFGLVVDYAWAGPLFVLASYFISTELIKQRLSLVSILAFGSAVALIAVAVTSPYPLLALPLIATGLYWHPQFKLPRGKWVFYVFYPVHFAVLLLVQHFSI